MRWMTEKKRWNGSESACERKKDTKKLERESWKERVRKIQKNIMRVNLRKMKQTKKRTHPDTLNVIYNQKCIHLLALKKC